MIFQIYSLSCESAALEMGLRYQGQSVTQDQILDFIGSDLRPARLQNGSMRWGNPYKTFVGNVHGSEVDLSGYGVYYLPLADAASHFGGRVIASGEGMAPDLIYRNILDGHPSVVWVSFAWDRPARNDYLAFDGQSIPYAGPIEHAIIVVGVSDQQVYVNDPDRGAYWVSKKTFENSFETYNNMAVILS